MASNKVPQPLQNKIAIVDSDGNPTQYFQRWAQERQEAIAGGLTTAEAEALIAADFAAKHVTGGFGLTESPAGGSLATDVVINLTAGLDDLTDVDIVTTPPTDGQFLKWDAALMKWVPGTGGSGGGHTPWKVVTTGTGASQNITLPYSGLTNIPVLVFVNGLRWYTADYSIAGTTLTLTTNASGDLIEIIGELGTTGGGGGGSASPRWHFASLGGVPLSVPTASMVSGGSSGNIQAWLGFFPLNDFFFAGSSSTVVLLDYGVGNPQTISGFAFIQDNTSAQGTWQVAGSNDNVTYTNLGIPGTWGGARTSSIVFANTTAYQYYRLSQVTGTTSSSPYQQLLMALSA